MLQWVVGWSAGLTGLTPRLDNAGGVSWLLEAVTVLHWMLHRHNMQQRMLAAADVAAGAVWHCSAAGAGAAAAGAGLVPGGGVEGLRGGGCWR